MQLLLQYKVNVIPVFSICYKLFMNTGEIFIFGGLSQMNRNGIYYANTISKYNPNNNTWLEVGPTKSFPTKATAVGVGNVAYICGGYEQVNDHLRNTTTVCARVEMYDTVNNTWKEGKNMIKERASCAAVHFDGKMFVFGGFGSNNTLLSSGEFMNIADGVWTMLTNNIPFQLVPNLDILHCTTQTMKNGELLKRKNRICSMEEDA
ncbi:kelch repeat and BTB domain-containing protein 12-like isoform X2 [Ciona intestinalis]